MSQTQFLYNEAAATLANASTIYVGIPVDHDRGCLGCQIAWLDATSAATITLELSNFGSHDAPVSAAGAAWEWEDSGLTITGPAATAAGSSVLNVENVRQRRARLKIVTTANSKIQVVG